MNCITSVRQRYPRVSKFMIALVIAQYLVAAVGLMTIGMEFWEYGTIRSYPKNAQGLMQHLSSRDTLSKRQINVTESSISAFTNTSTYLTQASMSSQRAVTTSTSTFFTSSNRAPQGRYPLVPGCTDFPEDLENTPCAEELRDKTLTVFLLAILVGTFGVGRCVAGFWCCGVVKCLTCGGCGIWWLLDWIFVLTAVWMRSADGCCFSDNLGV